MSKKGNVIANAVVNIIPSTDELSDGVEKAISKGTSAGSKTASLGISNIASGFAMGIGQAAFGAVTELGSKVVDVAKSSIASYAEYEQLIGGVETLFGNAGAWVSDFANRAYETAGLSANQYMDTVNSMAAALNQSTRSTWESAKMADLAVIDMADNANKMGTDMQLIQNAYSGFTKQNFTMLDNLKLGYGGTKSEMERLLADATKLSGIEYNLESYADIVSAIHVIQEEMGIAGTTQKEASTTIEGSLKMVQGAWTNLISGIANEDANLGSLFEKLIDSIFGTDGKGGFVGNILPRIEQALQGLTEFIKIGLARIPEIMTTILPDLVRGLMEVIMSIFENISANSDELVTNIGDIFGLLIENALTILGELLKTLPTIIEVAVTLIHTLAEGISEAIPELYPILIEVTTAICDTILDNLGIILDAAVMIILALVDGIVGNLDKIVAASIQVIAKLVATFVSLVPQVVGAAIEIMIAFITAMGNGILKMLNGDFWQDTLSKIVHSFTDIDWDTIGFNVIDGVVQGFKKGMQSFIDTATESVLSIKNVFTNGFKIQSPSKVFRYYGEMMDQGLALGIDSGESELAAQELAQNVNNDFKNTFTNSSVDSERNDNQAMVNLLSEQNDLLWQILNKNYGRSDAELFNTVQKGAKEYLRRTGSYAFGR